LWLEKRAPRTYPARLLGTCRIQITGVEVRPHAWDALAAHPASNEMEIRMDVLRNAYVDRKIIAEFDKSCLTQRQLLLANLINLSMTLRNHRSLK
jgi:hypothetical protein